MHNRQSIRLQEYDYSKPGAYFVTVCTYRRKCIFGYIGIDVGAGPCVRPSGPSTCPQMHLNTIGKIIEKWLFKLPTKFPLIEIDQTIIMPNHLHCIIQIVGARPCVRSYAEKGTHTGVPLHKIIQWFKTMTTNDYFKYVKQNGLNKENKLWQRNYHDRVIRNEKELNEIREYIFNNPVKWDLDSDNPKNINPM